jgi:ribosomal protein S18 acetylase RimI-like enzyme
MITYSTRSDGIDWVALKRALADDTFDNGRSPAQLERSFRNSFRCVYALSGDTVVSTGRALSDGVCNAYFVDLWTRSDLRRRGIGRRVIELLCAELVGQHVYLFTDNQQAFYAQNGFSLRGIGMERVVGEWLSGASDGGEAA